LQFKVDIDHSINIK